MTGKKNWYFADGYLPEKVANGSMEAHEALMLFNPTKAAIEVEIVVYFSDRDPIKGIKVMVEAERVFTIRLDHPDELGGAVIPPVTQYALHIAASAP
ncbi:MAG: sensory rhodopsin transducer, partial [Lentisphaeria bacterium]